MYCTLSWLQMKGIHSYRQGGLFNQKVVIFLICRQKKKTYVAGSHYKHLAKALLINTHDRCLLLEMRKILTCKHHFFGHGISKKQYFTSQQKHIITKTCQFKYTENVTTKKQKFSEKNSDIFHISARNIDCGYSLELPHWGNSNKNPQSMFLEEK